MSEAVGAAAGGAGDAGAAGAAAGAAGATGATGGVAAPAGGAGTGAVVASATAAPNYFAGLDADTAGWLQNKGYFGQDLTKADLAKGMPEVLKAHRSLESLVGKNRLPMPRDAADAEAYDTVFKALGRPADPAGYGIKLPEGGNKEYFDGMLAAFHKAGLSDSQAQAVAQVSNELGAKAVAAHQAAAEAAFTATSTADLGAQRAEWGAQADHNFAAGQRAAQAFGIDRPTMEKIERAIGTKPMLQLLSKIGLGLTEDRGAGVGGGGSSPASTVEAANAELKDLQGDKEWVKRFQAGEAQAVAKYKQLTNVLASAAA